MTRRIIPALVAVAIVLVALATLGLRTDDGHAAATFVLGKLRGGYTVEERVRMHADAVSGRVKPSFDRANVSYPPAQLAYIAFKDTSQLHVYARATPSSEWRLIHTYPILGMSGSTGPKLRNGDMQVPEGLYRAEFLNANSRFHLSIRLNYPNDFDRAWAVSDGRTNLGSDIMIHGTASSIGCLAMGNQVAEDLFILAALVGKDNLEVIVAPTDLRHTAPRIVEGMPLWVPDLYKQIRAALRRFPSEA